MFGWRHDFAAMDARIDKLSAQMAERDAQLRALLQTIADLDLPPHVPLRRSTVQALTDILDRSEKVMRGELPDRRSGLGRRAYDGYDRRTVSHGDSDDHR